MKARNQILFAITALLGIALSGCASDEAEVTTTTTTESTAVHPAPPSSTTTETRTVERY